MKLSVQSPAIPPPRLRYFLRLSYTGAQGAAFRQRQKTYLHFVSVLLAQAIENRDDAENPKRKTCREPLRKWRLDAIPVTLQLENAAFKL
jgi:hypothetical protein